MNRHEWTEGDDCVYVVDAVLYPEGILEATGTDAPAKALAREILRLAEGRDLAIDYIDDVGSYGPGRDCDPAYEQGWRDACESLVKSLRADIRLLPLHVTPPAREGEGPAGTSSPAPRG